MPTISDFCLLQIWAEISRERMSITNEEAIKQLRALMEDGVFLFYFQALLCLKIADEISNFELIFVIFWYWQLMIHWESRIGLVNLLAFSLSFFRFFERFNFNSFAPWTKVWYFRFGILGINFLLIGFFNQTQEKNPFFIRVMCLWSAWILVPMIWISGSKFLFALVIQ